MKDTYGDLDFFEKQKLAREFKNNLRTQVTENLATNIYILRIAKFYTKIAEEGLLEKISEISGNMNNLDEKTLGKKMFLNNP